jgi:DNA-binding MurR/RpiR family transcriptional regulator
MPPHHEPSFDAFTQQVRARFGELSPQYQAGAAFLLDHPDDVAVLSMRKVAERAAVQPATLVRLAQTLGFAGWNELRDVFVARVRTRPEAWGSRAASLVEAAPRNALTERMFAAQKHNLENTEARNGGAFIDAAKLLHQAAHIHVAGFRSCYPIAFQLVYGYRLFRPSVSLMSAEGGTLEMQLRSITSKDAVVLVSYAPYSMDALRVLEAARQAGARVLAITDSQVAPVALGAHQALFFSLDSPSFFPSTLAGCAVAESLLAHLLAVEGKDAVRRLTEAEAQLHAQGAYLREERPG